MTCTPFLTLRLCYWLLTYSFSYLIIVLLTYSYSYLIIVLLTVDILLFLPCDSVIDIHLDILRNSIVPTHVLTIVFYNGAVLLRTGFTLYPQLMLIYSKSNILFSILKKIRENIEIMKNLRVSLQFTVHKTKESSLFGASKIPYHWSKKISHQIKKW